MKDTCRYSRTMAQAVSCLAIVMILAHNSPAQADLQIMVNGSWDYVVDPHPENDPNWNRVAQYKRIVLVAPLTPSHGHRAYIFEGDNASMVSNWINANELKAGLYYLDLLGQRTFAGTPSQGEEPPHAFGSPYVPSTTIGPVISTPNTNNPRIAISLPEPDYYSTYFGAYGTGMSQSKISASHVTAKTPSDYYTTWMVLHFQVSASQVATFTGKADDGTVYPTRSLTFKATGADKRLGISVVLGAQLTEPDWNCDSLSTMSFTDAKAVWGNLIIYARFPEEVDNWGTQNPDHFHYNCPEDRKIPMDNMTTISAGSADCHKAQFNINSAIP